MRKPTRTMWQPPRNKKQEKAEETRRNADQQKFKAQRKAEEANQCQ